MIGILTGFDSSHYMLKVNVDGIGDTEFDVTGDSGASGSYLATTIVSSINTYLRTAYYSSSYPYTTFSYSIVDNEKVVLRSPIRTNSSYIKILPVSNNAMSKIFGASLGDSGDSHIAYTTGDYYLTYDSGNDLMQMVRVNTSNSVSNLPDLNFYTHFIWDRRGDTENLTETIFQTYLANKKIIGLNNVFKQTKFDTFSISGIIFYEKSYSFSEVKSAVDSALEDEFSFFDSSGNLKRDYGDDVSKSHVLSTILSVPGVERVNITYFGRGTVNSNTNEDNSIDCGFDEIIVLHEDGINFTYELAST